MAFRFRMSDGADFAFVINPSACVHLVNCVTEMGKASGWINADGEIIVPSPRRLES